MLRRGGAPLTQAQHLAACHTWLGERATRALAAWRLGSQTGESIRIVESVRDVATQQRYYAEGKSRADGTTTWSLHQFSPALALDVAVLRGGTYVARARDPAWGRWGAAAEAEGLEWGGRWTSIMDAPHVQVPMGERVRIVQRAVGATPDGIWGPATTDAVCARVPLRVGRSGWASLTPTTWAVLLG